MRMQRVFLSLFLCSHQICCNSFRLRAYAGAQKRRLVYGENSTELSRHTDGTSHIDISVRSQQTDPKVDIPLFRNGSLTIHMASGTLGRGSFATVFEASVNGDRDYVAKIMEISTLAKMFYHASGSNPTQEASIMDHLRGHEGFIQMKDYFSGKELKKLAPKDFSSVFEVTTPRDEDLQSFERARQHGELFIFIMEKGGEPWSNLARGSQKALFPKLRKIVASMHKLHIYHLDLRADNILVDGEGNIKLIDFGTATRAWHLGSFQERALSAQAAQAKGQVTGFGDAAMSVLQGCLNETAHFRVEQLFLVINPTVRVREGSSLESNELGRLIEGDVVKIVKKAGPRCHYQLQRGAQASPGEGWISDRLAEKPLLCEFAAERLATLIDKKCLEKLRV